MPHKKTDKKPTGGSHAGKRMGVNFTPEWYAVVRQLAAKKKQPVLWYLVDLAKHEADQAGIPTPALPWEGKSE